MRNSRKQGDISQRKSRSNASTQRTNADYPVAVQSPARQAVQKASCFAFTAFLATCGYIIYLTFPLLKLPAGSRTDESSPARLDEAHRILTQYISEGGGKVHPSLLLAQSQHDGVAIRGVITTSFLEQGKVILRVPPSLWLIRSEFSPEFMAKDIRVYEGCDHKEALASDLLFAAGLRLEQMKGDRSRYAPYFDTLPPMAELRDMVPSLVDSDALGSLVSIIPVEAGQSVAVAHQRIKTCFTNWQAGDDDVKGLDWDDIRGFMNSITRAFTREDDHIFVPYADMLNTGTIHTINVRWGYYDGGYFMYTTRDIYAGEELVNAYCDQKCDNLKMVWTYGIYLENNPNHIYPMAKLPACRDEDLRREALERLEESSVSFVAIPDKTAPRCKGNLSYIEMIQCSLARLAWEACGCRWEGRACPVDVRKR